MHHLRRETTHLFWSKKHQDRKASLCIQTIHLFVDEVLAFLFPQRCRKNISREDELDLFLAEILVRLDTIMICFSIDDAQRQQIKEGFLKAMPQMESELSQDAQYIADQDPAASDHHEVIVCYPGFMAIAAHRLAHYFVQHELRMLARIISEYAHSKTGIDIHPGAQIGVPFFIDHGTGIVIGESTQIGKGVKIYQGVTLGALSVSPELRQQKRHPTIEDDVVIYANATILGGKTVIGEGSVIGGNVWLTRSLPAGSRAYHQVEIQPVEAKT